MKFSNSKIRTGLGEAQDLLRWWFTITKSPAGMSWDEKKSMRVMTSELPKPTVTRMEIQLGGFDITQTGRVSRKGELTITFIEGVDAEIMDWLHQLTGKQSSTDGKDTIGKSETTTDNNFECQIQQLGPDDQPTQTYKLLYCLGSISDTGGELGQTSESQKPKMLITYDDYRYGKGSSVQY